MSIANEHVDQLVDDFVHENLSAEEAARVQRHCQTCPSCARALEQARRRLSLLQAMPPTEASSQLVRTTLDRIDEANQPSHFRRRLGLGVFVALAASALLLTCAHLYYATLRPNSIDLTLLGQREWLAATTAALRIQLVDRGSRQAMAGIPVVITLRDRQGRAQELASFTTDQTGSGGPRLELPDWPEGNYDLEVSARNAAGTETLTRAVRLKRSWKLLLSSDKPVYQPGQKILLRGLALRRPDLKPVGERNAVFTLIDPRGNVLFKHQQPTSRFGIASAECELDREIQEGTYTVTCNLEGTESRLAVEVRRYVLPKFKVTVRPDRPYYAPGASAKVRLQADYFFGKPVANSRFDYEIYTRNGQAIATGNGTTNDDGTGEIKLTLPANLAGRPDDGGNVRAVATVQVTDPAGQAQSATAELLVAASPIVVQVMPEAGQLVSGVSNKLYLLVSRPDGEPLPNVNVKLTSDTIDLDATTDSRGVATLSLMPPGYDFAWTVQVRDSAGELLGRATGHLRSGSISEDFLVRLDRAVYQAGQTVTLTALGAGVEPIFLDLIKDGQTMLAQQVELSDGKGELVFDLPAELFGTVQLVAYRFVGPQGLPLRKSRVVYIAPPDGLRIEAALDQREYRPGKEAILSLRLFDDKGRPTPGAVSLSAVDEAVFAVLKQKPGIEKTFYTLEQELLQPVYTIYPWQPEEDPAVIPRDQALFAATARATDPASLSGASSGESVAQLTPSESHSLAVRSLPIKEETIRQLKSARLDLVKRGWGALILVSLLCGYIALWMVVPVLDMLKFHAIGLGGLMFFAGFAYLFFGVSALRTFKQAGSAMETARMAPRDMKSEAGGDGSGGPRLPRVRRDFPETLLWKPELITDNEGRLPPLRIPLADSITTWRLSASAVDADGRLGATHLPITVFQPFFVDLDLPVSLTRRDEVEVRVVVHNYLDQPQKVTLTLTEAAWFTLLGKPVQELELAPREVRAARYCIRVNQVGDHPLKVMAQAGEVGDAIERRIEVIPDGTRIESAFSGQLASPIEQRLTVPAEAIEGSVKALVKLYPSGFSQLVEGMENIFRMPSGCFEQTSSTTYPNILALDYIRRNRIVAREAEAKARQYIHLGYQRLIGFEVPGGGFDWYGRPPGNVTLTAYGLMEFVDMARVHDVDPRLIERTRRWLLNQRQPDGSWAADQHGVHLAGTYGEKDVRLATTAYVLWAVGSSNAPEPLDTTIDWILNHRSEDIQDPHTLALVCNALLAVQADAAKVSPYLDRLAALAQRSDDGKFIYWQKREGQHTLFYGSGNAGQIETTALATLALMQGKQHPQLMRGALTWIVANKDPHGTWHSTQSTVLALKALLASSSAAGEAQQRRLTVQLGQHTQQIVLPADQSEVLKQIDLSSHLTVGENLLRLSEQTKTGINYQIVFRYHVPGNPPQQREPLAINLDYDRTELNVGGTVTVKTKIVNQQAATAAMVMVDLPIPPGFAIDPEDFQTLVNERKIERFQRMPRSVLLYLRSLEPNKPLEWTYKLTATSPVRVTATGAQIYEYYDPQKRGFSPARPFTIRVGK